MKCMLSREYWCNSITNRVCSWDATSSKYKIDSSILAADLDEFDEYPFVIRRRIGKNNRRANGGLITDIKYR